MAVSSDVRLRAYNAALMHLGARSLASVTEQREARRVLDAAWRPHYVLEQASWNFAMRTVQAAPSPSVEPDFGYKLAYDKPDDFARLVTLSADGSFTVPLTARHYADEAGYWFTDVEPLFARYVSVGDDYGMNSGLWTESFIKYLGLQLAFDCCERITGSDSKLQSINAKLRRARSEARANDASDEGIRFPPVGTWVRARGGC